MTVRLDEVKAIRQHDKPSISLRFCQSITSETAVLRHQHHYDEVKVTEAEKGFRIMKVGGNLLPDMSFAYAMMHSILSIMNSVEALKLCLSVLLGVRGYKKMEITSCMSVTLCSWFDSLVCETGQGGSSTWRQQYTC